MAGKIQNEDIKSEAELIAAGGVKSQLPNDTKIYITANGINKTLDDAISDGDLSGGGGGGVGSAGVNLQSSNYTIVSGDNNKIVAFDTSGGAYTATLPTPSSGFIVTIKDYTGDAGANNIGISRAGTEKIDSLAGNIAIDTAYQAITLISDGTDWYRLSDHTNTDDAVGFIDATGGTITTDGNFKVHTFNTSGTFTINSGIGNVDYLVIAGGGGGGGDRGGGGGAGGYKTGTKSSMTSGGYTVTIGAGGTGNTAPTKGGDGSNSVFDDITSTGGGGGGSGSGSNGNPGGSGGGGGSTVGSNGLGGSGTVGQGNDGGDGNTAASGNGGGGGGASAAGTNADGAGAGDGGAGSASSITGTSVTRAGGGGGGALTGGNQGAAGLGGGGAGATGTGANGTANTGGGAGGGGGGASGGNGGSGVVILRYQFQ